MTEPPGTLTSEERSCMLEETEVPVDGETPKQESKLSLLLEDFSKYGENPFMEFAKFDGRSSVSSSKKIDIFLLMIPPAERAYPMTVAVVASAKVQDLIGLICWQYVSEGREPKLELHVNHYWTLCRHPVNHYCLCIAEDNGKVDWDFPCLDNRKPVLKFSFGKLALVPKDSIVVTINIPNQGFNSFLVESLNISMRSILEKVINRCKIRTRPGVRISLEKQSQPGVAVDLDSFLGHMDTMEFCLVREDSTPSDLAEAVPCEMSHMTDYLTCHQYRTYLVLMVHRLRANTEVQLAPASSLLEASLSSDSTVTYCSAACSSVASLKASNAMLENDKLKAEVQDKERHIQFHQAEAEALKEISFTQALKLKQLSDELSTTTEELDSFKVREEQTAITLAKVKKDNAVLRRNASNVTAAKDAHNRRLAENKQLQRDYQAAKDHAAMCHQLQEMTAKKLSRQTVAATTLRDQCRQKQEEITAVRAQLAETEARQQQQIQDLKDEKSHYTDEVKACVIQLMGECDVSASKVRQVMQVVSSNLLEREIPVNEFPSKSTALHYADMGSALSRIQILNALTKQRFDLHVDGTSRDQKKVMGHQVTLQDKRQLSLGFTPVSQEDAQSIVDLTVNLFHEIAGVMLATDEEKTQLVVDIFKNLTCTMTDRAATMKLFGKKLSSVKSDILQSDDGLEFLFCNAHFLLGLSDSAQKSLHSVEERKGWVKSLGRDRITAFSHFKNSAKDPAACRLVRLACDIFGPRGDAKSGCRDEWLAFCADAGITSCFSSFRGNRFNNLFEGAAAVVHHLDAFTRFLSMKETMNLKLQSVQKDAECPEIVLMVTALAIVYVALAGPFWTLINSDIHFLDLFSHVQTMHRHLQDIAVNPTVIPQILTTLPSCLETFLLYDTDMVISVRAAAPRFAGNEDLHLTIQVLVTDFLAVIQRQLYDFLPPDGKYSGPPSLEQRNRMAHCKMNNLFGEANFGDMDLSLYTRRHSSLHHHSTINMLHRNKTMVWFQQQTEGDRRLLHRAGYVFERGFGALFPKPGVSGEMVEIDPIMETILIPFIRPKSVTHKVDCIADCDLLEEKSNGQAVFRLTYLTEHNYKHHDFEADMGVALEVIMQLKNILELRLSPTRTEFILLQERKLWRRDSQSHQQKTYMVLMVHRLRANTLVLLGVSGEAVEIDPVPVRSSIRFIRQKAVTHEVDSIADCDLLEKKSNGRAVFRLTYLKEHNYKHHDFEADMNVTLEIIQKLKNILELRLSATREAYISSQERKLRRQDSLEF